MKRIKELLEGQKDYVSYAGIIFYCFRNYIFGFGIVVINLLKPFLLQAGWPKDRSKAKRLQRS